MPVSIYILAAVVALATVSVVWWWSNRNDASLAAITLRVLLVWAAGYAPALILSSFGVLVPGWWIVVCIVAWLLVSVALIAQHAYMLHQREVAHKQQLLREAQRKQNDPDFLISLIR